MSTWLTMTIDSSTNCDYYQFTPYLWKSAGFRSRVQITSDSVNHREEGRVCAPRGSITYGHSPEEVNLAPPTLQQGGVFDLGRLRAENHTHYTIAVLHQQRVPKSPQSH